METLPPKTLKNQLVRLDDNLKQIERKQFAGIQRAPGSLPVLEAFQEFLDNERRKARRRMVALTAVFVAIFILAGAGTATAVYLQMKRMRVDYNAVSARTADLESKLAEEQQTTQSSLTAIEARLGEASKTGKDLHDELLAAHSGVADQVKADSARMAEMQAVLDRLADENGALKEDLDRVMKDWPSVTRQVAELTTGQPAPKPERGAVKPEPKTPDVAEASAEKASRDVAVPVVPVVAAAPPVKEAEPTVFALTLVPPGEKHGIRWRLPAIRE